MRSAKRFTPMLLVPIVALALVSFTVRFFHHPDPEYPVRIDELVLELANEAGWLWWPISIVGLAAVWFGRSVSRAAVAMYWLVPLWGVALLALNLGVWGAQKAVAICSPASREIIAIGSMGETYGIYLLAFAWSAAVSLGCAISTLREGRKGERGLAVSLLLTGISLVAATLQAGAIRHAMTGARYTVDVLQRAVEEVNTLGTLAGWFTLAAALVAILATWRREVSRLGLFLTSALTTVPVVVWAMALEGRAPMVEYLERVLPRAILVDGLVPEELNAPLLTTPDSVQEVTSGFESLRVGATFGADGLWRVFKRAHAAGTKEIELHGVRSDLAPFPFAGLEQRFDLALSATWVRLRRTEPCGACDVTVTVEGRGLRAARRDGSSEFWERGKLDESMVVKQLPGAEWANPPVSSQALVDASLIALSHGHVLVLQLR